MTELPWVGALKTLELSRFFARAGVTPDTGGSWGEGAGTELRAPAEGPGAASQPGQPAGPRAQARCALLGARSPPRSAGNKPAWRARDTPDPHRGTPGFCGCSAGCSAGMWPWWYEAYGQVDQHTFLYYNSSNDTCNPVGLFGLKVIKTEAWQKQPDILKDIGDILRQQLAHIKLESGTTKGEDPCTLLGKMSCQPEGNGKISGFWQLVYNGQILLHFDSNTQQWTEVHPGSSWIKKILEEDRSVTDVFHKTLVGDCASWLKQFWGPWQEMQLTAQPTPNKCTRITLNIYVVLCLALSTLFVNQGRRMPNAKITQNGIKGLRGHLRSEVQSQWEQESP
ncbi:UL16-binding protein 1-like [Dipodomys spectabilis]|uniref:UL16-binding protein 1-like n=1 Tax=Dipodomys spectabilis TaxID=105255 RepID=UPI001C53DC84|nr:UL16-binding protein 1-like [Dipodomys spectabilis]